MPGCTNCGAENPVGQKFCGNCGAGLATICSSCGTSNPPGQRFCGECGNPLAEMPARAAATAVITPAQPAPPAPVEAATERRLVSVLFADLVGFTTLSE